jgi:DUF4097 and DUF4098 domain-containing protein YvlB
MKTKIWIALLAGWGLCFAQLTANAQEYSEHISKQFDVKAGSVIAVYNIEGSIKVEGSSGDKVMIEVAETIIAKDNDELERGKKEVKLGFDQKADSVIVYTAAPYDTRPHTYWNNNDNNRHYRVKLEYTLKVPYNISLRLSTINSGSVEVKDVTGALKINNINGPITIVNAKGTTDAHTINGNLTVNYLAVPPDASSYYTLNGKLEVTYPATFAAILQFKSMNGKFYTDFENTEVLPTTVVVTQSKKAEGTMYKLDKNPQVKVGAGGKLFKFETLNGNIYIKKQS